MTLWERQIRRVVDVDAHGDRRVYWTFRLRLEWTLGIAIGFFLRGGIGRYDVFQLMLGPFTIDVERVADPT